jgi:colanic acid biosynthesis glycosyl transferase WcaI
VRTTLLTQFFPPETFAGANRVHALAAALAHEGEVTVVAPRPGYPSPELYRGVPDGPSPGLSVRRTRAYVPHGRSEVGRALAEIGLAVRVAAAAAPVGADVVVASSPAMFLGPAGLALARARRVPFVWDVRDLTWEYAREVTAGRRAPAAGAAALARLMWSVARRSDLLVAATPGIARLLRARCAGVPVLEVDNTIDADVLRALDPSPAPPNGRPKVTYAGLVGLAQALEVLAPVAERLPHVDFAVVGEGPGLARLESESRERGLTNLYLHGYLPQERLAEVYRASDVLFAQLHASPLHTATALPSKLFEYMAAGRPIVYAGDGLAAETLHALGCGIAVEPGKADAIAGALASLLDDPQRARELGEAGRRHVEARASREEEMGALLPELRRLTRRARSEAVAA